MSSPFTNLTPGVSKEQIEVIARTGQVPSNLKSEANKMYIVIFACADEMLFSNMAADELIDGEVIICEGREKTFDRIIDFLIGDIDCSIDIKRSRVLVEGVDAGKGVSLYRFIELCKAKYPDKQIDLSRHLEAEDDYVDENPTTNRMATGLGGNSGTMLNE